MSIELDSFDLKILTILQRDNRMPQRAIGAEVGLSAPAVQRRIQRLEDAGFIIANVAVLDPRKLNQRLNIIVNVDLDSERADLIDAAKTQFQNDAEVQQCYYVAGEADFVLIVCVASMIEYEALTRRLFFGNANVKSFRTFVAMDLVKVGLAISMPIPGDSA